MEAVVYSNGDKATAEMYRDRVAKLFGMPMPGTLNDPYRGKNVDLTDNVKMHGWCLHYDELVQNPSTMEWAHRVDENLENALVDPDFTPNVTSEELSFLVAETANKVTLDSTWFPDI